MSRKSKNLVTPYSINITVHHVEFKRKSESKVYLTMRAGRDYHWQPAIFETPRVKVNKDVEPRRADFNNVATLLAVEKPDEDVVEVELHQKGGVSSGIWARAKINLSKLPMNTPHLLQVSLMNNQNANIPAAIAHLTVQANGFGAPVPVQQVVQHTTETVYVPQSPVVVHQMTAVPPGQPMAAPVGQPVGQPVGTPVGQPMGQPMPQGTYSPQPYMPNPQRSQGQLYPQQPYMTNPQQSQPPQQPYLTNPQQQPYAPGQPMYYTPPSGMAPQQAPQMYQPPGQPVYAPPPQAEAPPARPTGGPPQ